MNLEIRNFTRQNISGNTFKRIVQSVMPEWEVSLVFMGTKRATYLNRTLRNKTYTPNVLSYVLGSHHGEIIICLQEAKKQARSFGISAPQFNVYLFIHGLLHLKGYRHGIIMERYEQKLLAKETISLNRTYDTTNCNRN